MESITVEYKREILDYKKLHKELVAFSNTNGGSLFIGVDDKGDFYKTPQQKIIDIYQGLKTYSDDYLKNQINNLWKIKKHFWRKNKKQLVYKITIEISNKPIASNNDYYIRIETFIQKVSYNSIAKSKNELTPTQNSFNDDDFQELIKINSEFSELYYRQSYKIVNEDDKVTIFGMYFSNSSKTNIRYKYNEEEYKIVNPIHIQTLFNEINEEFKLIKLYGVYRIPYITMIKNINEIARELILNAIAHGQLMDEITIDFQNGIFSVENKWPSIVQADDFITKLLSNKLSHNTFYPYRNRLLKKLKMIETESRGYNKILTPQENYWFTLLKNSTKIKIMIIPKVLKNKNEVKNIFNNQGVYIWQ